jgi:hypothetical protein
MREREDNMSGIRKNQKALLVVATGLSIMLVPTLTAADEQQVYQVGQDPKSVVMASFTDRSPLILDIAVANSGSDNLSILIGQADGTFNCVTGVPVATGLSLNFGQPVTMEACVYSSAVAFQEYEQDIGSQPSAVAVGDFNRDGKLDLAVANKGTNNVSIYLGRGDATFNPPVTYSAGPSPVAIAVGDFNRDGKLDLAVANSGTNYISVLLGQGNGGFDPRTTFTVGTNPSSIAVGDFDNDNNPDLAVANSGSGNVSVLFGRGNGSPPLFEPARNFNAGDGPSSVTVGDYNNDSYLDLAVANKNSGNVSVLLNGRKRTFRSQVLYPIGTGTDPVGIVTVNFDYRINRLDLITVNNGTNNASILYGNGDGTFQPQATLATVCKPTAVAPGYPPYGKPIAVTGLLPQYCPSMDQMDQLGISGGGSNGGTYLVPPHCPPPCHK